MNKAQQLTIDSSVFDNFKKDFNIVLGRTLFTMREKKSDEAEISVKFKLALNDVDVPGENDELDKVTKPHLEHKVSSTLSIKTERKGMLIDDYLFEYDAENGCFNVMTVVDPQMSMFEDEEN